MISFLIIIPENPENEYFKLFTGFYKVCSVIALPDNLKLCLKFEFLKYLAI